MSQPKDYDSTLARIAGNIVGKLIDPFHPGDDEAAVRRAVACAKAIVKQLRATPPREGE